MAVATAAQAPATQTCRGLCTRPLTHLLGRKFLLRPFPISHYHPGKSLSLLLYVGIDKNQLVALFVVCVFVCFFDRMTNNGPADPGISEREWEATLYMFDASRRGQKKKLSSSRDEKNRHVP